MTFFTWGSSAPPGMPPPAARTWAPHSMSKVFRPGTPLRAASASDWIFAFIGQAGVVSSIFSFTEAPETRLSFTIPAFTRSTWSSGSMTFDIAARTAASETLIGTPETFWKTGGWGPPTGAESASPPGAVNVV
jgi:hypothetical protein